MGEFRQGHHKCARIWERMSVKNSHDTSEQMGRTPLLSAKVGNRAQLTLQLRKQYHPTLCKDIYYVFNGFVL